MTGSLKNPPPELLRAGLISQIRLDLTTRCNLRCVYCAVSQHSYHGADMEARTIDATVKHIVALNRFHPLTPINVNGHGETTNAPGWVDACRDLLSHGIEISVTSNFAKEFDHDELETLARMTSIAVSIDTADRRLLRRLRRKVDVRQIITNIHAVRATALRLFHRPPRFNFLCGLYDQNTLQIDELARLAISLNIHGVAFWNLKALPFENTDVPRESWLRPLDDLNDEELKPRLKCIHSAINLLRRNGIVVGTHGGFVETLSRRVAEVSVEDQSVVVELPNETAELTKTATTPAVQPNVLANKEKTLPTRQIPLGATRDCLDPWSYIEFQANGTIRPCCNRPPIGNVGEKGLSQILDDEPIRRLRANLLGGAPDAICQACSQRAVTTPEALQARVRKSLEGVRVPAGFDPELYQEANADVHDAGTDPAMHFLRYGRFEGRPLTPAPLRPK
jgi:MoaA/NifB/PqqE/SkfB family radical SAM enzyme